VTACVFFALLPHVLYPWAWLGAKAAGVDSLRGADLDRLVPLAEIIVLGGALGVLLPAAILVPIQREVTGLPRTAENVLLAHTLLLAGSWIPLVPAVFLSPLVAAHRPDATRGGELARTFLALWGTFSVPLTGFLAVYLRAPNIGAAGEAAIMFFMLATAAASFFYALAPRLACFFHDLLGRRALRKR
jgi:hypothetical protein